MTAALAVMEILIEVEKVESYQSLAWIRIESGSQALDIKSPSPYASEEGITVN
jgi:hypothetical protein